MRRRENEKKGRVWVMGISPFENGSGLLRYFRALFSAFLEVGFL